ncbi:tubulin polyglutamylase complex subunit 2 [Contarinia nasturtii]|uniref:tubulin polyglutamylase complex subunit 2 n=1 Tax=Contarinia nasturtii TaxID=265458 RepID=UPI0012D4650B|nr:tubulin polyglutamylase complex subunit 2 [Contarinia nasturtii]
MASTSSVKSSSPEDEFYNNLTLNLIQFLNNITRITNVTLHKQQPCERTAISTFEQRHNIFLPDDMKRFYLSTDGFTLHWCFQYAPNVVRRVGYINFPHLMQITLLRDYVELIHMSNTSPHAKKSPGSNDHRNVDKSNQQPNLNLRSKIFELSSILDVAKVCLIFETLESINPKIYLLETQSNKWQFLADSFTEYLRMCIAHLGLPYWELCFAHTCALPSWAEQIYLLVAPHLLEHNNNVTQSNRSLSCPRDPVVYNELDLSIFRTKQKCNKQTNKLNK